MLRTLIVLLLFFVFWVCHLHARVDDGNVLFQGVMAARQDLAGKGEIELTFRSGSVVNKDTYRFEFENLRRRIESNERVNIFDAEKLLLYERGQGMDIRDTVRPDPSYCFDIRLLGLSATMFPSENLEKTLTLGPSSTPAAIGNEHVGGVECTIVEFRNGFDHHVKLWVDDTTNFRVHRAEFTYTVNDAKLIDRIESVFDGDSALPARVSGRGLQFFLVKPRNSLSSNEKPVIRNFSKNKPAADRFTMNTMGMETGTPITDIRTHERIGYWDGQEIVGSFLTAKNQLGEPSKDAPRKSFPFFFLGGVVLVGAGVAAWRFWGQFSPQGIGNRK